MLDVAVPAPPCLFREWRLVVGVDLRVTRVAACHQDVPELALLLLTLLSCVSPLDNFRRVHVAAWGWTLRGCRRLWRGDRVAFTVLLVTEAGVASQGTWRVHVVAAEPPVGPAGGLWLRWLRYRRWCRRGW